MSFIFYKKNGKIKFSEYDSNDYRITSTIWCIIEADKIYNWTDFDEIKIFTGDYERNKSYYTYSKRNSTYRTVPDFNFHCWKEAGIDDYEDFIHTIHLSGLNDAIYNKVGWIGAISHSIRQKVYDISLNNKDCIDFIVMKWKMGCNKYLCNNISKELSANKYIYTPDLVKKYSVLIDIEGNGYSGRLKHLLWSHRPVIIVDREHKEFFFDKLESWKHYIPVKRDLSDLFKNIKWCLKNKEEAKNIAENAYNFSKKYLTRESCFKKWNNIIIDHIK